MKSVTIILDLFDIRKIILCIGSVHCMGMQNGQCILPILQYACPCRKGLSMEYTWAVRTARKVYIVHAHSYIVGV